MHPLFTNLCELLLSFSILLLYTRICARLLLSNKIYSEEKYCGHGMRWETIGMRILMVIPISRNIYLIDIRISHYNDLNVSLHYSKLFFQNNVFERKIHSSIQEEKFYRLFPLIKYRFTAQLVLNWTGQITICLQRVSKTLESMIWIISNYFFLFTLIQEKSFIAC